MTSKQKFSLKAKHKRLINIIALLCCICVGIFILSKTFRENLIYFYSPTDLERIKTEEKSRFERISSGKIRVGGLVKEGSIEKLDSLNTNFILTDDTFDIKVTYKGILPPLFRELQGIVAEGRLNIETNEVTFSAENLLTKHDENYMPPEVADSLKYKVQNSKEPK
jgi:cytochrome c-type biogenesis protein CcmE